MRKHVWLPAMGVWAEAKDAEHCDDGASCSSSSSFRRLQEDDRLCSSDRGHHGDCSSQRDHSLCDLQDDRLCSSDRRRHGAYGSQRDHSSDRRHHGACRSQRGHSRCDLRDDRLCSSDRRRHGACGSRRDHSCCDVDDELHHSCLKTPEGAHQTCPICLSTILPSDIAVLRWCMHRFCLACIEKWSAIERFCPLCKQTFRGWYFNIRSPTVFDEKYFCDSSSERHAKQRRRYLFSRPQVLPYRQTSRAFYDRCGRDEESEGELSRPRVLPYRQTSRAFHDHCGRDEESEGEQAIRWRARIYAKNLRAVPIIPRSRVKVFQSLLSDPERKAQVERRLEPWIRRELQAIAGHVDHALLIHLVLALWLRFLSEKEQVWTETSAGRRPCKRGIPSKFRDADALRQLEPFLQEKATLFWHELRCFAESPYYSIRAYDSVVKYR